MAGGGYDNGVQKEVLFGSGLSVVWISKFKREEWRHAYDTKSNLMIKFDEGELVMTMKSIYLVVLL